MSISAKQLEVPYKVYHIQWRDHTGYGRVHWRDLDFVKKDLLPITNHSVGWLVKETEEYILIVPTYMREKDYETSENELVILKSDIIKKKLLK